MLSVKTDKKIV